MPAPKSSTLPFSATTVDKVGSTPHHQTAYQVVKLTVISFCLSVSIIVLSMVASWGTESCFVTVLASAVTMIHNATCLFESHTRRKWKTISAQLQVLPSLSAHGFMIFFNLLFIIPAWFIVIGYLTTDFYFLGLGTQWEILWEWGSAAVGAKSSSAGPVVSVIWAFEFTFVWFEIVILSAVAGWSWKERKEILEGSTRVEEKW